MWFFSKPYITLERLDGCTKWRSARFVNLNRDYWFTSKCAFYSQQDEARVSKYFRSSSPGFRLDVHGLFFMDRCGLEALPVVTIPAA